MAAIRQLESSQQGPRTRKVPTGLLSDLWAWFLVGQLYTMDTFDSGDDAGLNASAVRSAGLKLF